MRVTYLQKNKSKRPHVRRALILIAIFISAAIVFSFLNKFAVPLASPIWKTENLVIRSFRDGAVFFNSQKSLVEENARLKEQLSSLESEMFALSAGRIRESELLELIGRKGSSPGIIATVLTRPPQTPYDVIVIDAGSSESVAVGAEVSLPEGPLLGMVSQVFSKSAQVKLFSANGEKTNAVLERNNAPINLVGAGGGNFEFSVPRDIAVEKGDRILSADIRARHLATVGEIQIQPTDSFKEVLAKSPANIFTLRFVFITP
ncbi:MAG: rod shape-determining protein MreC [Candidatus Zambryskibacteria bacterium]|nr:rod shape-determining protein MreC [Candidatus Zambryskibacteria bacterium]